MARAAGSAKQAARWVSLDLEQRRRLLRGKPASASGSGDRRRNPARVPAAAGGAPGIW